MTRIITNNHMASGVHTEIEYPERLSLQRRFGWGLYVEQAADPPERNNNWFHLGIPYIQSDRRLSGGRADILYLQMELNENARLAEIHVLNGGHRTFVTNPNIIGRRIDDEIVIPTSGFSKNPFTVSLRIEFLSGRPIGAVTFYGAGLKIVSVDNDS